MTTVWRPDLKRIRAEIAAEAELELEVKVEASDGDGEKQGTKRKRAPSNKGAVRARGEASLEVQGVQRLSARSSAPSTARSAVGRESASTVVAA